MCDTAATSHEGIEHLKCEYSEMRYTVRVKKKHWIPNIILEKKWKISQ